jgi:OmpA-OmpF porin, OOP family
MKLTKISIFACLLFATQFAQAQFIKDYRKEADQYYEKGSWQSAAICYEKYLTDKKGLRTNSDDYNPYAVEATPAKKGTPAKPVVVPKNVSLKLINYRIAECYKNLSNYKAAEPWYEKVVKTDKESYPLSSYNYAVCLRALAKYKEAETQFSNFLETYKADDEYSKKAKAELTNLKFILAQMKSKEQQLYVVNKMNGDVNTTNHGQNAAPFVSNSTLYFTSSRPDSVIVKKKKVAKYQNKLYASKAGATEKATFPGKENVHQGAFTFTPDGNTVYFQRWDINDLSAKTSAIYKSTQSGANAGWSEPEKVAGDINVEGYTSKQPMLTLDGKYLLYASNKPGGQGGFDIWYASVDGDKLSASTNFGNIVNTVDNEVAPFYHAPSKQLVFANEGRVGMGGYDLFSSKGSIGSSFGEPMNLGYPINSQKNEEYFFNNDDKFLLKNFYLSSDRASDCCLELYSANKLIKKWINGKVVDAKTGKPLANVTINGNDDKGNKIPMTTTDENGNYFFITDPYNNINADATRDGYNSSSQTITGDFNIDTLQRSDWALTPIPPPVITDSTPIVVRFDFNQSIIPDEYKASLDALATMMAKDKEMTIEIGGYTDHLGSDEYNLDLSQKRAEAGKQYMIDKYATDSSRISTKAYGECCPIEKEKNDDGTDNENARKINRRLEFKMTKQGESFKINKI